MIYPFAYNAVTKTLRVYTRLEIVMEKVSDNGVNAKTARKGNVISMDPEIKSAYSRRFINFEEATAAKYEFWMMRERCLWYVQTVTWKQCNHT